MKAMKPDPRTPFDSVPEAFERWRPRYCDELFDRVAARAVAPPCDENGKITVLDRLFPPAGN